MERLVIFTEAGDGIGYGHLFRCLAIQKEFNSRNVETKLVLDWDGTPPSLDDVIFDDWINNYINYLDGSVKVLIDSYLAKEKNFKAIHKVSDKLVAIDDYNRIQYHSDGLINPNVFGDSMSYDFDGEILSGSKSVILRDEFLKARSKENHSDELKTIFVTLGGTDYRKLIPRIIHSLGDDYNLVIAAGNNSYAAELREKYSGVKIEGLMAASQMIHLMLECDMCISACGQTLNELAYLGVPTLGICIDVDQVPNYNYYKKEGILISAFNWDDDFEGKLILGVSQYKDQNQRKELSSRAKSTVKGDGVKNIFNFIDSL